MLDVLLFWKMIIIVVVIIIDLQIHRLLKKREYAHVAASSAKLKRNPEHLKGEILYVSTEVRYHIVLYCLVAL